MASIPDNLQPCVDAFYQGCQNIPYKIFDFKENTINISPLAKWAFSHIQKAWEMGYQLFENVYHLALTIIRAAGASLGGGAAFLTSMFDKAQVLSALYLPFSVYNMVQIVRNDTTHWTEKLSDVAIEMGYFITCSAFAINGVAAFLKVSEVVAPALPFLFGVSTLLGSLELVKNIRSLSQTGRVHQMMLDKQAHGEFTTIDDVTDEELKEKFGIRPDRVEDYRTRCEDLGGTLEGRRRVHNDLEMRIERKKKSDIVAIIATSISLVASVVFITALLLSPASPVVLPLLIAAYVGFSVGGALSIYNFCFNRHTEFFPLIPDEVEEIEMRPLDP